MRSPHRLCAALVAPALGALLLTGCFESAKPSELSCTADQFCPRGYVCVSAGPGLAGACQKPKDAAAEDAPVRLTDASDCDGLEDEDGAAHHGDLTAPRDGQALAKDAAQVLDQAVDMPVKLDAASDVPPGSLGLETFSDGLN